MLFLLSSPYAGAGGSVTIVTAHSHKYRYQTQNHSLTLGFLVYVGELRRLLSSLSVRLVSPDSCNYQNLLWQTRPLPSVTKRSRACVTMHHPLASDQRTSLVPRPHPRGEVGSGDETTTPTATHNRSLDLVSCLAVHAPRRRRLVV